MAGCVWEDGTQAAVLPLAWHGCHLIWEVQGHSGSHLQWGGPMSITAGFVKLLE